MSEYHEGFISFGFFFSLFKGTPELPLPMPLISFPPLNPHLQSCSTMPGQVEVSSQLQAPMQVLFIQGN
jgi:hypothetical protein